MATPKVNPQYQFAAPRSRRSHWTINRIDEPTPYVCLRGQLTQAVFDPFALAFVLLVVFVHLFYIFATGYIQSTRDFGMQLCQLAPGDAGKLTDSVFDALNTTTSAVATVGLNSVKASVLNLGESSFQGAAEIEALFTAMASTLPSVAQLAMRNNSAAIDAELQPQLAKAQNMSAVLLNALAGVGSALQSSGLVSLDQANVQQVFNISVPEPATVAVHLANFSLQTQNASGRIQTALANAEKRLLQLNEKSFAFTETNLTVQTSGCGGTFTRLDAIQKNCKASHTTAVVIYSLVALAMVLASCLARWYNWSRKLKACKRLQERIDTNDTIDLMAFLRETSSPVLGSAIKWLSKVFGGEGITKTYFQWVAWYVATPSMATLLLTALWILLLALPTTAVTANLVKIKSVASNLGDPKFEALAKSINEKLSEREVALNTACQSVLTDAFREMSAALENLHDQLLAAIKAVPEYAEATKNLTVPFSRSLKVVVPGIDFPRTTASALAKSAHATPVLKPSVFKSVNSFEKASGVLWLTFVVMIAAWVLWGLGAAIYAHHMAGVAQLTSRVTAATTRIRRMVEKSEAKDREEREPLSPPPLPPRDAHRPHYLI